MKIDVNDNIDFVELWKEGMRNWDGVLPERMVNDELEEAFWQQLIDKKTVEANEDPYAKKIQGFLDTLILPEDEVLEIGPGWGNYTFFLAEKANNVTCVDSSASVLEFLKRASEKKQFHRMQFIEDKWEEHTVSKKYDVVFGMNCFYRMYQIEKTLRNIQESAKRLAIIGMTSGPIQPHYLDLEKEYGYKIKYPRRDYIHLQNILYEMGIYANCKIILLERTYQFSSFEELITKNKAKILNEYVDDRHVEKVLEKYITEQNGTYRYKHDFHAALLYWEPERTAYQQLKPFMR
ncbi:class I SAM-dependent methyltransferase [Bacillus sp. FJAT-42315]|uniref:class I SAM-dependent methyltransferase n=1 Tax=Bacillus sp. FJAT-42315 TaxID=2014077 RepID=UPI000C23E372|nr:class I SAM-dependent methyltransferase [Bacillus sp. FJAT-42315]